MEVFEDSSGPAPVGSAEWRAEIFGRVHGIRRGVSYLLVASRYRSTNWDYGANTVKKIAEVLKGDIREVGSLVDFVNMSLPTLQSFLLDSEDLAHNSPVELAGADARPPAQHSDDFVKHRAMMRDEILAAKIIDTDLARLHVELSAVPVGSVVQKSKKDERDEWIYWQLCNPDKSTQQIADELKRIPPARGWYPIERSGLARAANAWAKRTGHQDAPERKPGRRTRIV